ncbi:MCE family protein [Persicimonas caeni]|uniref:MCE family protein n=1 Tax=Persicimonas caeni TaxID=2292766 RepID=A0A4Y6PMZ2_PERCE|nr:MlaD family protein [Persicimonas caeni]QDG49688.1 MCE family protein [Persicimonas caeni]QED30909.1 MCE family protein [Persicimonas caeni]
MKLKNVITPFKVGLLVLAGIVGTIFMIVQLTGGVSFSEEDSYTVYAHFDDVTGLAVNSRVMMAGIPIGQIKSIELAGAEARVDVAIDRDIKLYEGIEQPTGRYKNGATVAKKQASLIGDFFLEITPGTEGDVLDDGDRIHNVVEPVGPEELFERFNEITADIQQITESLSAVFGGEQGQQKIEQLLADLQEILGTLRTFVGSNSERVGRIVANAEMISRDVAQFTRTGTESLDDMIKDARTVVQEVKFIIGQSSGDLQAGLGTLRGTLSRLQTTLDSLNYSLQNVQDITDKVNEGEGTLGALVNSPTIAEKTERILADAEEFTGRLTRLKTIVQLRSEYHIQHEQLKNVVGVKLQPEPDKYYLLQLIDDFRGNTSIVREDINTTDSSAEDPLYRETTVTTTDDFKFSAQLARGWQATPWFMMYGRFGIMESSGGLGADFLFGEGQDLQVQTDVFDFSVDRNPRFRAFATYEFFEYAYIMGGVDDVLNEERRDYFLGVGLEFDDEDLKAIITTTGVPSP